MSDNDNFKEGLKGTSIFGGVGIINIIISIVKSKLIAVLLGTEGMGLLGLFNSSTELISRLASFGLRTSAVKDISEAYGTGDYNKIQRTIYVFKKLIILTGIIGTGAFAIMSPFLSYSSFGNYAYIAQFLLISLFILLNQLLDGANVLMQGMRQLASLAKSNVYGNLLSLAFSFPFYYFGGLKGIAPSIVIGVLVHYLISLYYANKINIHKVKVSLREALINGRGMLKMGFLIALQGILLSASGYAIRAYISYTSGVSDVGLYTAGFYIINTYTSIVFSAMSTEYYPRLASIGNNQGICSAVNTQTNLTITLLSPLIVCFIILGNILILLLYTEEFLKITWMTNIAMIGMFLKGPAWCLGYVLLAKGESKLYFWSELVAIIYTLVFNVVFLNVWGLTGMGFSFALSYGVYWIQIYLICKVKCGYSFDYSILKQYITQIVISLTGCIIVLLLVGFWKYMLGSILIISSLYISYRSLSENLNLEMVKGKLMKKFMK
ncbi:MAG: oligosaccharide flippase family protein [Aeriscardovia sp.]|nr:oligosaccharide flippase family protein [Aeriscardovia sp.]